MRYAQKTLDKIEWAKSTGAEIVINANYRYTGVRAGYRGCIKLAQTNDRRSGFAKRVVWACYR